jgi:hypothetical protein
MKRCFPFTCWRAGAMSGLGIFLAGCSVPPPTAYYPHYFEGPPVVVSAPFHSNWRVGAYTALPSESRLVMIDGQCYWQADDRYMNGNRYRYPDFYRHHHRDY